MPPRQYVPSTWAGHTRSCRSAPIRPISSCVWTAPGRSTMTTRPVSSAVTGGTGRGLAAEPVQAPRVSPSSVVEVDAGEVADDHGGGRGGADVLLVEGAYGRGVDALDRLLGALARPRHARRGREQLLGELLGGAAGRVGQLVRDLVEPVAHQPLDLAVRERGRPQGVGEQAQGLGQPGGRAPRGRAVRRGGRRARRGWRRSAPARRRTPRRSACRCPRRTPAP